jgi:hypothetical protein
MHRASEFAQTSVRSHQNRNAQLVHIPAELTKRSDIGRLKATLVESTNDEGALHAGIIVEQDTPS